MNRIEKTFAARAAEKRKVLVPYITAGDPKPAVTVGLMHAMVEAGADIIELGVPFSDPMADGPVIQAACERALVHDVTLRDVIEMVRQFRADNNETPVVLMGYLNPIEVMGYATFAKAAADAGVDGVLTVDLPPEEGGEAMAAMDAEGLAPIFLVAPTTTGERLQRICAAARGFVYYVSLKGVTGAATLNVSAVADKVTEIRQASDLPVGVGFGIRDAQSAAAIGAVADAVVVGSALIKRIEELRDDEQRMREAVAGLLSEMRQALDAQQTETA
ncbi:tryptophan synthase subunit alpha [Alkalilimnicola ehrlichii]|uniref:Tryptophan synthase alpha chain n=1 Tax=Alkalilimnicola ehrlichii TaxID=351052 RepID=A0A3E0X2H6_9GAMM|nr:tryptophan synthase subunit alpha [Alkalilimnicola ehrlichii]RFA30891.1 tryptophan synthase subunit alpha [Alkalilimnicola ehrlichii]RFA38841.1 tryptophan synthase subunit alpha [Alkalilimnicola ehrlichii]